MIAVRNLLGLARVPIFVFVSKNHANRSMQWVASESIAGGGGAEFGADVTVNNEASRRRQPLDGVVVDGATC